MNSLKRLSDGELLELFNSSNTYDLDVCVEIVNRAGLTAEWDACDGETFENVLYDAISILCE